MAHLGSIRGPGAGEPSKSPRDTVPAGGGSGSAGGPGSRALQLWSTKIQGGPVVIRSDSSVALSMSKKMSSPTKTLNYLAAKIALLLEHATITKLVPQHVPGKLNTEADWLSRLGDRGQMPPTLVDVKIEWAAGS